MQIRTHHHTYLANAVQNRNAIEPYREWITSKLGISLSDAVVLHTDVRFQDAAVPHVLNIESTTRDIWMRRAHDRIESVEIVAGHFPLLGVRKDDTSDEEDDPCASEKLFQFSWCDGPLLLTFKDLPFPVVTLRAAFHDSMKAPEEAHFNLVILARSGVGDFLRLLNDVTGRDPKPKLIVAPGAPQPIAACSWDDLVLDNSITSLLKDDFESFFERKAWFARHHIPFRRGYLLHGPPGNGKTSVIRAMMTARSLPAYTVHFYKRGMDDDQFENMFREATRQAPALVLLEDIDRAFPRSGQSGCKISLQQLLNSLDGVATGEGIITVATANEPTALDPAILRRPGRFDRVVCFPNPSVELRHRYFVHIDPVFDTDELDAVIRESDGFSFAQLREAHIMSGQSAYRENRDILCADLLDSVRALRGIVSTSKLKSSAGFAPAFT